PDPARSAALQAAREYNAQLPPGVLRDPYTTEVASGDLAKDPGYQRYERLLVPSGAAAAAGSAAGVIGELDYPGVGLSLPIYHGTGEQSLTRGVGHLYGSSLPVGGSSTHAVLTSHSGQVNASLFSTLPEARLGDVFQLSVLGERLYYRVDRIDTVLPEQTENLTIIPGGDYVTLVTCTPIGINSHRLLVRGERVAAPQGAGREAIAGDGRSAGFPWWAPAFLAGSGAVAWMLFGPSRRARRDRADRTDATGEADHS
ncbi:MAG: class C sortase, partial [Actinobacteria bacterium]|nr:class C sortase [Actinomycetota bacterium]